MSLFICLLFNRLQYFASGTQNYIKELKNTIVNNDDSQEVCLGVKINYSDSFKCFIFRTKSVKLH